MYHSIDFAFFISTIKKTKQKKTHDGLYIFENSVFMHLRLLQGYFGAVGALMELLKTTDDP